MFVAQREESDRYLTTIGVFPSWKQAEECCFLDIGETINDPHSNRYRVNWVLGSQKITVGHLSWEHGSETPEGGWLWRYADQGQQVIDHGYELLAWPDQVAYRLIARDPQVMDLFQDAMRRG